MGRSPRFSIFSVLLVISVVWKPILANGKCEIGCKGSASGASFLSGHKYNYGVEGTVSVYLTGADKQESSVRVLSQVSVTAVGNCVHELKVANLVISGPDGKKYSSPPGIDKPVRFTLQDGRVGADICSENGDTRRSLNIKRAIISLLQTEQKPSTLVDVFGACPTEVVASQEGSALLVHQSRDLSRCAHREQGRSDLVAAVYNPSAEIKDTQVLQSILNIESKVISGIPEKVAATEEYLYKPFSVGDKGAKAKVLTKLTLTGKAAGAASGAACTERQSIIFENPHGVPKESNAEAALTAVKEVAKTLTTEASSKSAGLFSQLVRIFRSTNNDDLKKVFNQVKGNNLERRVFLDGLLRTGTGDSIETSIDIAKSKELNQIEQYLVFISLGNAKHVNNDALKAATSLLDQPNLPKEIYLGVGALAGTFCREHNCHTDHSAGIAALSSKLVAKLNCKPKSKVEEDRVIAILKGIRSIHHLEDSVIDKLAHCANDNAVKARVRSAALEAYLADPCAAKLKKSAIDTMKNRQLDSEIRIRGYLAVIGCPCGKSATEIKNLLENEPVHQVGRFISTSLRHIRASTSPDKFSARQHYGQIRTPNKFNVDDRKYSFYREGSFNVDSLGLGGSVEETVIYSQDSFLPRSASLNVSAEVFGHNINVFEIGGRQGNLDRVLEHIFGPRSDLRTKDAQTIYDNVAARWEAAAKKVQDGLSRGRRDVKTEVKTLDDKIKSEATSFNNELDLDIYLKIFGTNAIFLSLGDDKGFDANKIIDQLLKYANEGINKAKHLQQDLRAHALFLDSEFAYPTLSGFPLKLNLVGAATGRLDLAANVDFRQIINNPQNAKVDLKVVPSVDIDILGAFTVDADAVLTGLKVNFNLHSSTGTHIIAKVLENGRGFDLQIGLPIDKQELVTLSHDLVFVTAEKGQKSHVVPLKVGTERKEENFCFDQLKGFLGQTICLDFSVPVPGNAPNAPGTIAKYIDPLGGPSHLKVVLHKDDLKGYHIKGVLRNDNNGRRGFEVLFDAEGSKNRRTQIEGEYVNNDNEKTILLSLESPIKSISGQVSLYNKPSEFVALVKGKLDAQEYYAKVGFNVQGNTQKSVYRPIAEYLIPGDKGKQSLKIDGQLIKEVNGPVTKYTMEGIKVNLPSSNEVVDVNGHFTSEPKGAEVDIKAKKGEHNLVLSGSYKGKDGKLLFTNTLNPNVNFKAEGHFQVEPETIHNSIDLYYGGDLRNSQSRITFSQLLKYTKQDNNLKGLITKNKFEIHAIPLKIKLDGDYDSKKLDIDFESVYLDKKVAFDLESRNTIKKQGDYALKIEASADKHGIEILSKRDIVNNDKSNLENYVDIKGFGRYELSGVVHHKRKPNDVHIGAVGQLKISAGDKKENVNFDIGLLDNSKQYSSHAKISSSKGQWVDYYLKFTRGSNANGQLKFVLKDTVSADGQFKVTDKDGRGNGMLIVDFKKSQRKIKAEGKFVAKDPIFSADIDIFLNFEKDNNDKIHFSTNTKNTDALVESKNKLVYAGKTTEVNVHRVGKLEPAGKSGAEIEIVLPTERVLSLKIDRDMDIKKEIHNGHNSIILSDAVKRGGPASTISYKAKVIDTDYSTDGKLHYEGQIDLKLKDGKTLQETFVIKSIPEGEDAKLEFKADVTGNLLPKPASLIGSIKYSDRASIDGNENYRLKGTYGEDLGFELIGKGETKLLEKGEKKYLDDSTLTIRLPFEKAHDIKIVSSVLYLKPQNPKLLVEYTIVESVQINSDLYKIDASGKVGVQEGFSKVKVVVPHVEPVIVDASYKAQAEGKNKAASVDLKLQYGKGKSVATIVDVATTPQETKLNLKANLPQSEKLKKLDLAITTKRPTPDTLIALVVADLDGKVYKTDLNVVYSKAHPQFDIKSTCPNSGETSRIYLKGSHLSSSSGKMEVIIEKIYGFSLNGFTEATIQKDNVAIKIQADSEKLGFKNYKVDIASKDAGSGKRLEFHASNDNKNLLSGSTSFISKTEGQKTIIEGSGSVKVRDEQKSANFKYIRTLLTEGSEQGAETFLNLAVGERSYVAETRVTNLEYKNSHVYCEEKKQCAHAELSSKLNVAKTGVIQHSLNIGLDLRKLGVAPEFGLQATSEASPNQLPSHTLDLHVNKADHKYHLHVYNTPTQGSFPAGITITLPKRVVSLEAEMKYGSGSTVFPVTSSLVLHLDKNNPKLKTAARMVLDLKYKDEAHQGLAEFGFSHPKLGKEAIIRVSGNVATPAQNSIKIETATKVSHPTLGNDREGKIYFEANPTLFKLLINTPIVKVIDIEGRATLKDNLQQADLKFSLLQGKPVSAKILAKDFQYYEFSTGYTDETERKLSIIGHLEPEKKVDISADIILPGEKKNIIHGAIFLKDNLLKTDYGVSKDNFAYFINALKKDLTALEQRIRGLGEKASNEFKSVLGKVQPTVEQLENAYSEEIKKLYSELSNDHVLKEISHTLNEVVQTIAKIIEDIVKVTKPVVDSIWKTVSETSSKVKDMYEKQVEPQLKQLYSTLAALVQEYLSGLVELVAHVSALVADFIEKHMPQIKELTGTLTDIFKDLTKVIVVQLKELREKAAQLFQELVQQIKQMPFLELIKEKWQELAVPEQALALLQELHNTIKNILPTEDIKEFADALFNYVQKKLRQEKVDDAKELRVIYQKLVVAISSILQVLRPQLKQFEVTNLVGFTPMSVLGSVPRWGVGGASFSVINQLMAGDVPDPVALTAAYRPRGYDLQYELPPSFRAVVVQGQHIFTFDGRHVTLPGSCRYLLAHDLVDNNFTLYLDLHAGAPKAIGIIDNDGVTLELKDNGQVEVNGQVQPLPVFEKGSFAVRTPAGKIILSVRNSLILFCEDKLEGCLIRLNGFYMGKTRGLLGDANNEPFDDFRLPNGKISTSEAEFANAYRLGSGCPGVKPPAHTHAQMHGALPAECEVVLGAASPLRPLALLLDVAPFRQACVHAVASGGGLQAACAIAGGYAALAVTGALPALLPPACLRCTDAGSPRALGDLYELPVPAGKADVVVLLEETESNAESYSKVLVPLVAQLLEELKAARLTDIRLHLAGVSTTSPYLDLYDTDLKLKTPKPNLSAKSRQDLLLGIKTKNAQVDKAIDTIIHYVNVFRLENGLLNIAAGYNSIDQLQLRPDAVKHTISVVGEKCPTSLGTTILTLLKAVSRRISGNGIHSHSLLTAAEQPAELQNVVGYTPETTILLGGKQQSREAEPTRTLFEEDSCALFIEAVDGVVIPARNYLKLSAPQQAEFLKTASAAITRQMTRPEVRSLECSCAYRDAFEARSVCVPKQINTNKRK